MITIKQLKKIEAPEELDSLNLGKAIYEIGGRGGKFGFSGSAIAENLNISESDLPRNYGVYCNYLGGGIRGALIESGYNKEIAPRKARLLDELAKLCIKMYVYIESDAGLNDAYDEEGEPNWENQATMKARQAGVERAY